MKIKYIPIFLFIFSPFLSVTQTDTGFSSNASTSSATSSALKEDKKEETIYFNYENKDLIEIIYEVAAKKNTNVILPVAQNELKIKVTLHIKEPLTIDQAWKRLNQILDIAGYCLFPEDDLYKIIKNSKLIVKEVTPLYTVPVEQIPDTDERIRYLYYPKYLQISTDPNQDLISQVVKSGLSEMGAFNIDPASNAILISDKANNIKSIMIVIESLDKEDFKEDYVSLKLRYTSATTIARLFSDNFFKPAANEGPRYAVKANTKQENSFFSQNVKIVPDSRSNQLFILGKKQAIEKVKEFILTYIDKEPESGKSILHVYELLYLDVAQFTPILESIVSSTLGRGPAQSSEGESTAGGLDRFFEGVIIKPALAQGAELQFSSNKLIIAAKNEDWLYIKKLIEELDIPQKQVIIEVLIADLSVNDVKQLGTIMRNPTNLALKPGVSLQSAEVNGIIIDNSAEPFPPTPPVNPATTPTLKQDLLWEKSTDPNSLQPLLQTGDGQLGEPGSTVISFNDPGDGSTFGILKLLENFTTSKILSHPHVIANNNKEAFIKSGEKRLVPDEVVASSGGQVIPRKIIEASVEVKITPRISANNLVNMQVDVKIEDFLPGIGNARTRREFTTNATVKSNEILALGGLIKSAEANGIQGTPILSKIPILGWIFKNKRRDAIKTNLTVFISPTVILPRLRGGINQYTDDYITLAKSYSQEAELFDGLNDPITRFFFNSTLNSEGEINKFLRVGHDQDRPLFANNINAQSEGSTSFKENFGLTSTEEKISVAQQTPDVKEIKISPEIKAEEQTVAAIEPIKEPVTVIANTVEPKKEPVAVVADNTISKTESRENRLRALLKNESGPFLKS